MPEMCNKCKESVVAKGRLHCRLLDEECPQNMECLEPELKKKLTLKEMTPEERREYNQKAFRPNYYIPVQLAAVLLRKGNKFFSFRCRHCKEYTTIPLKEPTNRKFWICMCGTKNNVGKKRLDPVEEPKYGPSLAMITAAKGGKKNVAKGA